MLLPLWFFETKCGIKNMSVNLILCQLVGAFMFYNIDKKIFGGK